MKHLVSLLILVVLAGSCRFFKGNPNQNSPVSGETTIAVDESLRPVFEAETALFGAIYGYADLRVRYLPERQAIQQLLCDSVQLVVACRELFQQEVSQLNDKKLYPKQLLVAKDGIAMILPPVCIDTVFSFQQVTDLLTGKISDWQQLNPLSASKPIRMLFDHEDSGIVRFLADSLCHGNFSGKQASALKNSREIIEYVSTHEGTIGFVGAAWIGNHNDSLHLSFHHSIKIAAIGKPGASDPKLALQPFQAYLSDHLYPLTRSVYMINAEPRNGVATGFTAFVAGDKGQRILLKSGLVPVIAPTRVVNIRTKI